MSKPLQWAIAILALVLVMGFYWYLHMNCEDHGGVYVRKWSGGYVCMRNAAGEAPR